MIIRRAKKEDLDGIYKIFLELARTEDNSANEVAPFLKKMRTRRKDFEESVKKNLLKSIRQKNSIYLVAESDNKLVGYAYASVFDPKDDFFKVDRIGCFNALVVSKNYRNKGLAKEFNKKIEAWFKKNNCEKVYLEVFATNIAQNIYEKWGYKDTVHKMWKKL